MHASRHLAPAAPRCVPAARLAAPKHAAALRRPLLRRPLSPRPTALFGGGGGGGGGGKPAPPQPQLSRSGSLKFDPIGDVQRELGMQSNRLDPDLRERVEAAIEGLGYRGTVGEVAARAGASIADADRALKALAYDALGHLEVGRGGEGRGGRARADEEVRNNRGTGQQLRKLLRNGVAPPPARREAGSRAGPRPSAPERTSCEPQNPPNARAPQVSRDGEVVYSFDRGFKSTLRNRSLLQRLRPLGKKAQSVGAYLVRAAFGSALLLSVLVVWLAVAVLTSSRDGDRCGAARAARRGAAAQTHI
jgi:hypothetical protein